MHGPEELLASCAMRLVANPVLLAVETRQLSHSKVIIIAFSGSVITVPHRYIKAYIACVRPHLIRNREEQWNYGSYRYFFFFGAITIIICRPSIFGNCSTMAISSKSFSMRFNRSIPISRCAISRPR